MAEADEFLAGPLSRAGLGAFVPEAMRPGFWVGGVHEPMREKKNGLCRGRGIGPPLVRGDERLGALDQGGCRPTRGGARVGPEGQRVFPQIFAGVKLRKGGQRKSSPAH